MSREKQSFYDIAYPFYPILLWDCGLNGIIQNIKNKTFTQIKYQKIYIEKKLKGNFESKNIWSKKLKGDLMAENLQLATYLCILRSAMFCI